MPSRNKLRDVVIGELSPELLARRRAEGWRIVAVEWERDGDSRDTSSINVPFGLRVAHDCRNLEEDPEESEVLRIVMQMVVAESRLSAISAELNRRGLRTRAGSNWSEAEVFRLMPVLVDSGPRIFADRTWSGAR